MPGGTAPGSPRRDPGRPQTATLAGLTLPERLAHACSPQAALLQSDYERGAPKSTWLHARQLTLRPNGSLRPPTSRAQRRVALPGGTGDPQRPASGTVLPPACASNFRAEPNHSPAAVPRGHWPWEGTPGPRPPIAQGRSPGQPRSHLVRCQDLLRSAQGRGRRPAGQSLPPRPGSPGAGKRGQPPRLLAPTWQTPLAIPAAPCSVRDALSCRKSRPWVTLALTGSRPTQGPSPSLGTPPLQRPRENSPPRHQAESKPAAHLQAGDMWDQLFENNGVHAETMGCGAVWF